MAFLDTLMRTLSLMILSVIRGTSLSRYIYMYIKYIVRLNFHNGSQDLVFKFNNWANACNASSVFHLGIEILLNANCRQLSLSSKTMQ